MVKFVWKVVCILYFGSTLLELQLQGEPIFIIILCQMSIYPIAISLPFFLRYVLKPGLNINK